MGRKSFITILATMALIVTGTSLALATEPNFGGEGNFSSGDSCGNATPILIDNLPVLQDDPNTSFNEEGYRMIVVDGVLHQGFHRVDANGNSVLKELDTILPTGTYLAAPDVRGQGWIYNANCDPINLVMGHIENRDPNTSQRMLVLPDEFPKVYELFVPVSSSVVVVEETVVETTSVEPIMDPDPVVETTSASSGNFWDDMDTTGDPVIFQEEASVTSVQTTFVEATLEDPFNQNGDTEVVTETTAVDPMTLAELCSRDDSAMELAALQGLPLAASRDICNNQADVTQWCGAHSDYTLVNHPELATAGSYIVSHFEPYKGRGDVVTLIPHGRYRMARDKGFPGHAWEFGVNCTYDQVYDMAQLYIQSQGLSPDVFRGYDDPEAFNGYFSNITYQGDYRGGNTDPERDTPVCRSLKKKYLLANLGGVIARDDDRFSDRWNGWISMQPWKSGTPEYETFEYIPEGKSLVYDDSTIDGSVWLMAGNCTEQWMKGNAKQSHNSRVRQFADNEEHPGFRLVKNLEGQNSPISGWFALR